MTGASEPLNEVEREALANAVEAALSWGPEDVWMACINDGNEAQLLPAVERIVASREAAAATRARAEALREAADALEATGNQSGRAVAPWLRDRADSLAPDTAGEDTP